MKTLLCLLGIALAAFPARSAELKSGPPLPYHVVEGWAQLPKGMNFGECSGVAVDKSDRVWVFNRGAWPVIELDKSGKVLQSFSDDTLRIKSSHGIRVDSEGNLWLVDVDGHVVLKTTPDGKVLMVLGDRQGTAGNNDSKAAFNRPTGVAFLPNGDFLVSDGYINSRVVRFNKGGAYVTQWGTKGTGDAQFDLVHDVTLDSKGRVYVADRSNNRIQIFDTNGKFLAKWTDIGQPWGLDYSERENAIYMCDGVNNRIVKLNLDGQILGVLASYGKGPGELDFAHNIAVDSEGSIYVSEIKNWRVQKWVKQ